jgi:hypothetical protein
MLFFIIILLKMNFLKILFIYYILKKMTLCSNFNNSYDVLEMSIFNGNESTIGKDYSVNYLIETKKHVMLFYNIL